MTACWRGGVRAFVVTAVAVVAIVVIEATRDVAAADLSYQAIVPQRLLDSRFAVSVASAGMVTPGVPVSVTLPKVVAGAAAVALNVTVTQPTADGFATVYPCGQQPPDASDLNFRMLAHQRSRER
jgi:hypothetical protein